MKQFWKTVLALLVLVGLVAYIWKFEWGQEPPSDDDKETIASLWVRPTDALQRLQAGELSMFPPTIASLRFLGRSDTVAEALAASEAVGVPPMILPRMLIDDDGAVRGVTLPGQDGYDDVPLPEFVIGTPR